MLGSSPRSDHGRFRTSDRNLGPLDYCRGPMSRIPINIAELVGGAPLVGLPRMLEDSAAAENGVELFAKLESFNPGGASRIASASR